MYFKLNGRIVEPCNMRDWADSFSSRPDVGLTMVGETKVSTIFLGLDHNFLNAGPPVLFETMVFGGKYHNYMERYSTYEEAEVGHQRIVGMVQGDTP